MTLRYETTIDLLAHCTPGGFDHAAVHRASARLYVRAWRCWGTPSRRLPACPGCAALCSFGGHLTPRFFMLSVEEAAEAVSCPASPCSPDFFCITP